MHEVSANRDGEITSDRAGRRDDRIGRTNRCASDLDCFRSLHHQRDDWTAGDVVDQAVEERLADVFLVMFLGERLAHAHHFKRDDLQSASFQASDDFTDKPTLNGIRFCQDESSFHEACLCDPVWESYENASVPKGPLLHGPPPCDVMRAAWLVLLLMLGCAIGALAQSLLISDFSTRPDGVVTNEYAYRHPADAAAHTDPIWDLTSGSLFVRNHQAYSGIPDRVSPNATSSNGTDSAVFRARTKRSDFGNVTVSFDLQIQHFYDNTGVPPHSYDGVHVWLRYQSEYSLYAVTVSRRDNIVIIKKKSPGGPSNGGTYNTLASRPYRVPFGAKQHVQASAQTNADGSVAIELRIDGRPAVSAVDNGSIGGPPLSQPGRVGIRGDNCEFYFSNFTVSSNSGT